MTFIIINKAILLVNNMSAIYDNEIIQRAAKRKGLNPTQVAALSGKSVPTVYEVYKGSDKVNLNTLQSVVEAVGLQMREIFTRKTAA
ncbi:MAG: helix-turn-helix domain-containing protein [Acidobacteria bacterium]|nr:helix-turn-helix domain-containing protein [Acidobacteriota bacterium]